MAETIRLEVIDMNSGGAATASSAGVSTGTGSPGGTGTNNGTPFTDAAAGNNWASMLNVLQRIEVLLARGRRGGRGGRGGLGGDGSLEGRGWAHYLNQQQPFASFGINQMHNRQEERVGWARDLMGLPDRMERAIIKAQHNAWGKDPQAFEQLQKIQQDYRGEKYKQVFETTLDSIGKFSQHFFSSYKGMASESVILGKTASEAGGKLAGFATLVGGPMLGAAVWGFAKTLGKGMEIIGHAQGNLTREGQQVAAYSPELRMQGIVSSMREMRTDMEIARQFGGQMAKQNDMESRREAAYRLLTTKVASTVTKPFEQMNEAWTTTLEVLSGQREAMDLLANAAAAIPGLGGLFKENADKRNAEFKEKQNMKDIENGKALCEAILGVILPGEIGIGEMNERPKPKKKQMQNAVFDRGGN